MTKCVKMDSVHLYLLIDEVIKYKTLFSISNYNTISKVIMACPLVDLTSNYCSSFVTIVCNGATNEKLSSQFLCPQVHLVTQ
jgi:hypothetical protein